MGWHESGRCLSQGRVIIVKKAVIFSFLMLVTGFVLWQMIVGEFFNPAQELAVEVEKENFAWFSCSNCGALFMAEETTRKGYCPYCKFQMMLATEDKKVLAKSPDKSEFTSFLSPECGKVFFANATGQMGNCPYCKESIDLTAPIATVASKESPDPLVAWANDHYGKLLLGAFVVLVFSVGGIYVLLENRIILSLNPIEKHVSEGTKIEFSKWRTRKKKLTLGDAKGDDIILKNPSLKGVQCELSFVRVGGKTRAYLRHKSNHPILVNEKPQYNPRLKDHDKVRLGDLLFEVHAREE
jgi:DNA-directed RNA polymerase subunit RPC12/RpoP